eukprot:171813_1
MDTAFSTWLVTHGLQSWIHWVLVAVGAYYDEFNPLFPIHSSHQRTTYYSTLCHKRTRQTMVSLTVMCVSVAVAWVLSIATIIHHIFLHNLALHSHYIVGLFASPIPVDVVICDHINPLS